MSKVTALRKLSVCEGGSAAIFIQSLYPIEAGGRWQIVSTITSGKVWEA